MTLEPTPDPEESQEAAATPGAAANDMGAPTPVSEEGAIISPRPARRDALPFWVVALLLLFLATRLYEVLSPIQIAGPAQKAAAQKAGEGGINAEAMQDLLATDLMTKTASIEAMLETNGIPQSDRNLLLAKALEAAEDLQGDSGSTPGTARRVLILRAMIRMQAQEKFPAGKDAAKSEPPAGKDAAKSEPPAGKGATKGKAPAVADPLEAFALPPTDSLSAADKARYAAEAKLWRKVLGSEKLSASQIASLEAQIRAIPNIRWWRYPALSLLHGSHNDAERAAEYAREAGEQCVLSILGVLAVGMLRFFLIVVGFILLGYFIILFIRYEFARTASKALVRSFWKTEPAPIADDRRRLSAGDLMGVFVLYLVVREIIGLLLTGYDGFGPGHIGHFAGPLAPLMDRVAELPSGRRSLVSVSIQCAMYLISIVPSALLLVALARRRRASLADEIGWNTRKAGPNVLYAFGGIAVAYPIMIAVILIAPTFFKHMPDPANPAIPQLINSSNLLATILLAALASVAAPIIEEFLFRGVLYQAVRLRVGVWPAIVLTGLLFGFVHPVGVVEMFPLAVFGGVLAWLTETRKSLFPGMVAHGVNNLTTTLLLLWGMAG